MATTPTILVPSPTASPAVEGGIAISRASGRRWDRLAVSGELDLGAAPALAAALHGLDVSRPLRVGLGGVRFADTHGLTPLFDGALQRRALGCGPLQLVDVSPAVERVLLLVGVRWTPQLDLDAWRAPRAAPPVPRPPVDRSTAAPAVLAASLTHARPRAKEDTSA